MEDKIDKTEHETYFFNDKKYLTKENHTVYELQNMIKFILNIYVPPPDKPHRATILPGGNIKLKFFKTTCKEQ